MKKFKIVLSMLLVMVCALSFCACEISGKKDKGGDPSLDDVIFDQTYCVSAVATAQATNLKAAKNLAEDEAKDLYFKVLSGDDKEIAIIYGDKYTVGTYTKADDIITATFKFGGDDEEEEESEEEIERTISIQLDGDNIKINETTETSDKIVPDSITIEPVEDTILEDGCYTLEAMNLNTGRGIEEDGESGVVFIKNGKVYSNDSPEHVDITKTYYLGNQMFYKCYSGTTGEYTGYGESLFIIEKPEDHDPEVATQISAICDYNVANLTWIMTYEKGYDWHNDCPINVIYYHIQCDEGRLETSKVYQQFKDGLELEQIYCEVLDDWLNNIRIYTQTTLNLKNDGTFELNISDQIIKKELSKYIGKYILIEQNTNVGDEIDGYTVTEQDVQLLNNFDKVLSPLAATGKWYITYYGIICEFDEPTVLGTVFGVGKVGGDMLGTDFDFENEDNLVRYALCWQEKAE